jgi:hypothetical protein
MYLQDCAQDIKIPHVTAFSLSYIGGKEGTRLRREVKNSHSTSHQRLEAHYLECCPIPIVDPLHKESCRLNPWGGLFRAKTVTFNREAQQLVNHCPGGFQGAFGTGRTRRFGIQNRRFCEETPNLLLAFSP